MSNKTPKNHTLASILFLSFSPSRSSFLLLLFILLLLLVYVCVSVSPCALAKSPPRAVHFFLNFTTGTHTHTPKGRRRFCVRRPVVSSSSVVECRCRHRRLAALRRRCRWNAGCGRAKGKAFWLLSVRREGKQGLWLRFCCCCCLCGCQRQTRHDWTSKFRFVTFNTPCVSYRIVVRLQK